MEGARGPRGLRRGLGSPVSVLFVALGVTAGIALVSYLYAPDLWRQWLDTLIAATGALLLGAVALGTLYFLIAPKLPDVETLRTVELQEPMYVYSRDGKLIALFGETRRYPISIEEVPQRLKQAFLAAEVRVERAGRAVGCVGDGLGRHAMEALRREELGGGGQQALAGLGLPLFLGPCHISEVLFIWDRR